MQGRMPDAACRVPGVQLSETSRRPVPPSPGLQPRAPGQFRFPHFLVLGFPKCATTSIYCHLIQHPQVQHAKEKESHVLVNQCGGSLASCAPEVQRDYIVEVGARARALSA